MAWSLRQLRCVIAHVEEILIITRNSNFIYRFWYTFIFFEKKGVFHHSLAGDTGVKHFFVDSIFFLIC